MYNEGISKTGCVIDLGVDYNVVDKRGAFFRYGETLLGQGRENSKQFLHEHPEVYAELDTLIRQKAGLPIVEPLSEG